MADGRRLLSELARVSFELATAADLRLRFARDRQRHELLAQRCVKAIETNLWKGRRRQEFLELHLSQISPLAVLGRGYAIVQDASGRVVRSAGDVLRNELLRIRLHRGELEAAVTEVHGNEPKPL